MVPQKSEVPTGTYTLVEIKYLPKRREQELIETIH